MYRRITPQRTLAFHVDTPCFAWITISATIRCLVGCFECVQARASTSSKKRNGDVRAPSKPSVAQNTTRPPHVSDRTLLAACSSCGPYACVRRGSRSIEKSVGMRLKGTGRRRYGRKPLRDTSYELTSIVASSAADAARSAFDCFSRVALTTLTYTCVRRKHHWLAVMGVPPQCLVFET